MLKHTQRKSQCILSVVWYYTYKVTPLSSQNQGPKSYQGYTTISLYYSNIRMLTQNYNPHSMDPSTRNMTQWKTSHQDPWKQNWGIIFQLSTWGLTSHHTHQNIPPGTPNNIHHRQCHRQCICEWQHLEAPIYRNQHEIILDSGQSMTGELFSILVKSKRQPSWLIHQTSPNQTSPCNQ